MAGQENNRNDGEYKNNKIKEKEKENAMFGIIYPNSKNTRKRNAVNKSNFNSQNSSDLKMKSYFSRNDSSSYGNLMKSFFMNNKFTKIKEKKILGEYLTKTDNELNFLDYNEALLFDNRTICRYYISLIRTRNLIIFTFSTKNDYNPRSIKICFFFFMLALILIINILFIDDSTLHDIFINQGKFDYFFFITKIVYVTIISYFFKILLISVIPIETTFIYIKKEKNKKKEKEKLQKLGIKLILIFGLGFAVLFLFWIYVFCFFGIFVNTYIFTLKIFGMSIGLFLFLPFIIYIIPSLIRFYSLSKGKNREYAYKFSQLLQYL